ncbi:hypothetical protein HOK021_04160 [Streptomyces hygroscopicus]|nr:hypothetical protein HOK021_04160 [Streptomyces hygroscopicus]
MAENTGALGITGCTNFENMSHHDLYAMVADGDHMQIGLMGTALVDAGKEISRITKDLQAYAKQVHWQGDGAQAFDDWTKTTAAESHKLGHYARSTGEAMVEAASALGQAKLMPKPPALRNFVETDPGKANGVTALTKDPAREDALAEMNRLASYYRTAQQKIAGQEAPNFQPASGFVPWDDGVDGNYVLDHPAISGNADAPGTGTTPSSHSATDEQRTVAAAPTAGAQQAQQVSTSVDSTATVAPTDTAPPHGGSTPPHSGGSGDTSRINVPGPTTLPGGWKAPGRSEGTARGSQRITGRPGRVQGQPIRATDDGIVGATGQRGGTATGRPRLPGGSVIGEDRGVIPPRQTAGGGNPPGTGSGTPQGSTGNSGQRTIPPRGETAGKSRGAVMGEEHGSPARGLTGGGLPGGSGNGVRQDMRSAPGRRLAYEPGGTAGTGSGGPVAGAEQRSGLHGSTQGKNGSRGVAEGAADGMPSATGRSSAPGRTSGPAAASRAGAGDFTSGGSGLTRSNTPGGMLPMSGTPSSQAKRRTAQRPDYLREDEEMWSAQSPAVVPPVID